MSIKSQIERIQSNVTASLAAVAEKGVAVASDSTSDDLPSLISSINTQSGGGSYQPYNLLDNSDFTNPVNQREQSIYSTSGAYTFDRWLMASDTGSGMVAVGDGYIGMNASSGYVDIMQVFEHASRMTGKAYTFAVMRNGATTPEVLNFTFGTNNSMGFSDGFGGLIHYNGDRVYIRVTNTGSSWVGFLWAALYEGTYTADTLPKYIPKGYDVERLVCLRYYEKVNGAFIVAANKKTLTSVQGYSLKRIAPTLSFGVGDSLLINRPGVGTATITVSSVDVHADYLDHISINESLTFGDSCIFHYTASADL